MKTTLYCTFLLALFVDRRHSQTVIVESPSAHPELGQADGEALYLHARGDGRTLLLVEGTRRKTISILDVTNPAQIYGIARANISATGLSRTPGSTVRARSNPIAPGMVEGARSIGMPTFDSSNGRLMEGNSGATILERGGNNGCRANKPPHLLFWSVSCHYEELVLRPHV
jgi:hypothetical protein